MVVGPLLRRPARRTGEDRYVVWAYAGRRGRLHWSPSGPPAAAQPAAAVAGVPVGRRAGAGRRLAGDPGRVRAIIAASPVLLLSFAIDIAAMVLALPRALFPQVAAERFGVGVGRLAVRGDRASARWSPGSPRAGSAGSTGRASRWSWRWWSGGSRSRAAGLAGSLWLAVLLLAVGGAADLVSAVYRQTILQTYAPDGLRGRMQGVFIAVVAGGPRLGDLRAGFTADLVGPDRAWVGGGIAAAVVAGVLALAFPALLRYTPRPAPLGAQPSVPTATRLAVSVAGMDVTGPVRAAVDDRRPAATRPSWSRSAAGCATYRVGGADVVDGYAEDELCPGSRRAGPRPVAQPDPRRSLHVRRRGATS